MKLFLIWILFFILGCDARIQEYGYNSNEILDHAIAAGDVSRVRKIIDDNNLDVNSIIEKDYRWRPIHVASYYGQDEVIEYLLKKGADIDAIALGGNPTALLVAIWKGHENSALLLLRRGANSNIETSAGLTACVMAKRKQLARVVAVLPSCLN